MTKVWRWIRRWWWTILVGAGVVFGVIAIILRPRGQSVIDGSEPSDAAKPMPFADLARQEVERVRLEGELERARVSAQADARAAELNTIEQVGKDNPAEGRRQLAAWLATNL